ncbi:MAG: transglycosylase domain-containing protein [Polaromonas sp.]|nr:transglycosylase domain-containing protein [Polaromonas sp.]
MLSKWFLASTSATAQPRFRAHYSVRSKLRVALVFGFLTPIFATARLSPDSLRLALPPKVPMNSFAQRLQQLASTVGYGLRHPTRRGVLVAVAAVPVLLLGYVLVLIPFTPSTADLMNAKTAKPSVVMSADGVELAVFKRADRDRVALANISPNVVHALIATEDRRFYEHHGIDFRRTFGAALHSFTGDLQGGSTLTQQLARNLYPEGIGRAPTLSRKVKEAITAIKIEAVYSKDEILQTYLNTVPFLYNAYGIDMAARTYFDKTADTLDVLEAATLVGMLKGTSYYNPVLKPERALARRNTVLAQMVKADQLSAAQFEQLKGQPLKVEFERQSEPLGAAPHFIQQMRRWLIEWADRNDYNIYADGLVLHTTIDSRLQDIANAAVTAQGDRLQKIADADGRLKAGWTAKKGQNRDLVLALVRDSREYKAARNAATGDEQALAPLLADDTFMEKLRSDKTRVQAGFMAINPTNGHVVAWVGSRDFQQDQFDHVAQARRQPGSTFKPFVYGAAFQNGAKPGDALYDRLLDVPQADGTLWQPSDGGGVSGELMTLRRGLAYSKNTITAQVMMQVGPAKVAALARSMGVRQSTLDEVPSLALGTSPVTLKEMVTAYATLANDGRYNAPVLITRVDNRNGKTLEVLSAALTETAMPVDTAQTLLDVLRTAIDHGTGAAIRSRFGIRADVAGKTGTTQNNTDGWFILMHPQLVAGAWAGFNDNRVTMGDRWGPGAQSALPMVGTFFQGAIKSKLIDVKAQFNAPRVPEVLPPPAEVVDPLAPPQEVMLPGEGAASGAMLGGPPGSGSVAVTAPGIPMDMPTVVMRPSDNPLEGGRPRPMDQLPAVSAQSFPVR